MEAVLLIGIQGSGKTTFYLRRFFETHVRLSLDLLRTRHRQHRFLETCLATQQRFVIDNTNLLASERATYIAAARAARFRVIGYYFEPDLDAALRRNQQRTGKAFIPIKGIIGAYKRLQPPSRSEGFDELYSVLLTPSNDYHITLWSGSGAGP
ncbi:MAG: AAA family ATPase [Isosphaeraceae bacterium]|nr:AAA family ATPase [Isosphaeraceae bacterium]